MTAPEASSEVADSVTSLPLMRSAINTTLVAIASATSRPISVIDRGRSQRARPTRCAGFAASSAARSAISIPGKSQCGPKDARLGSAIENDGERHGRAGPVG